MLLRSSLFLNLLQFLVLFRTPHEATWAPILWALKLMQRAREEGKISIEAPVIHRQIHHGRRHHAHPPFLPHHPQPLLQVWATLVNSFDYIEDCNRKILNYGWIEFPLAYTQVSITHQRSSPSTSTTTTTTTTTKPLYQARESILQQAFVCLCIPR